ncbi:MAG: ABC transporter permease [Thermoanaerobaculia bacterium]
MIRHLLKLVWNRKRANALIVAEIFVSFLVVFGVMTGAITLATQWNRPLGYEWRDIWDVRIEIDLEPERRNGAELRETLLRMEREVETLPEVESAAIARTPPYALSTAEHIRFVNGRSVTWMSDEVSDGFLETMQLRVVRGRWFDRSDDGAQHRPVVLDSNAARATWDDADPIGKTIEDGEGVFLRVVGVVEEFRKDGETALPRNMIFHRFTTTPVDAGGGSHLLVRLRPGTDAAFEETLLATLQGIAPDLTFRVRPMDQMRQRSIRMILMPLVTAGIVALFLVSMVALGLTGVLWQNVTRRTREIGVRRALGATGGDVYGQVLGEVVVLTSLALALCAGVVLQLPILGIFRVVPPGLFTVGLVGALAAIYVLTLLCALYPSWLASRLQPADALRYE